MRMARIGLLYVDIYLYTVAVGVDCGAFSCSCDGVCACVYMYLFVWLVVVVWLYLCIYVDIALVRCGGVLLVVVVCPCRVYGYIYIGTICARAVGYIHLPAIVLYPKFKQFSRLNAEYMQKSAKNRIFCMDICKTTQKIKIENHACIVQYVYTIQKIEIEI